MAVEGLDARQQLAVVAARDQHLRVRAHSGLQDRERARRELVLFKGGDFKLAGGRVSTLCVYRGEGVMFWWGEGRGVYGGGGGRSVREFITRLGEELSRIWLVLCHVSRVM